MDQKRMPGCGDVFVRRQWRLLFCCLAWRPSAGFHDRHSSRPGPAFCHAFWPLKAVSISYCTGVLRFILHILLLSMIVLVGCRTGRPRDGSNERRARNKALGGESPPAHDEHVHMPFAAVRTTAQPAAAAATGTAIGAGRGSQRSACYCCRRACGDAGVLRYEIMPFAAAEICDPAVGRGAHPCKVAAHGPNSATTSAEAS